MEDLSNNGSLNTLDQSLKTASQIGNIRKGVGNHAMLVTGITGYPQETRIVFYIFSGLSGGTGSGLFLDVCYLARKTITDRNLNGRIHGYFFMPDINHSVIGANLDHEYRMFLNAYASLQELNYCMNIPGNGGAFTQRTNIGEVKWNCPPVDICHLIGAEMESDTFPVTNKYRYAIYSVAEYVMNYLLDSPGRDAFDNANLTGMMTTNADSVKTSGYNPCVVSIGVASARVPYKEIYTYLVSSVFEEYRKKRETKVTQTEVSEIITELFGVDRDFSKDLVEQIYESIRCKLSGDLDVATNEYECFGTFCEDDKPWRMVKKTIDSRGDNALQMHYAEQLYARIEEYHSNLYKLIKVDEEGSFVEGSLMKRFEDVLHTKIMTDISKGPAFVKTVFDSAEDTNVFCIIGKLKMLNRMRFDEEISKRKHYLESLEKSKNEFFASTFLSGIRRKYDEYEFSEASWCRHCELVGDYYKLNQTNRRFKGLYELIDEVIDTFEKQLRERVKTYYRPYVDVIENLTETFAENRFILENFGDEVVGAPNEVHLVPFRDVITTLDNAINEINVSNVFTAFVDAFVEAGPNGLSSSGSLLTDFVNDFFAGSNGVFKSVVNVSIDTLLTMRYGSSGERLVNLIDKLVGISAPLLGLKSEMYDKQPFYRKSCNFPVNSTLINHVLTSNTCAVSPNVDSSWRLNLSSIMDRILLIQIKEVFPIQACRMIDEMERYYYEHSYLPGIHLYEKEDILKDCSFSDWRKLPAVTCMSRSDMDSWRRIQIQELLDRAFEMKIVDEPADRKNLISYYNLSLNEVSPKYEQVIVDLRNKIEVNMDKNIAKVWNGIYSEIEEWLCGEREKLIPTELSLFPTGCASDSKESVLADNLYNSPVYQIFIKRELGLLEQLDSQLEELRETVKRYII